MKIISFDADGTLIDLDFVNAFWDVEVPKLYAEKYSIDYEKAFTYVRGCYDALGDEDLRWYQPHYWFDRFKLKGEPEDIINNLRHKVQIFPDALNTIEKLHGKYDLVVVSNAPREFLDVGLEDIKYYFSSVYSCTTDFGMVRKKPEVYLRICEELRVMPEEIVHVGDHYKFDYEVPQSIGIRSFYVNRNDGDMGLRSLTELIDELNV